MAITINGSGTVTGLSVGGLPDGTVDSGTLATDSVTAVKIPDTVESSLKSGRKNLFINGGMDVWQRGDTVTSNGYLVDRWMGYSTDSGIANYGVKATKTQDNPVGAYGYCAEIALSNTGGGINYVTYGQRIEASTFAGVSSGATMTLSLHIKRMQAADSNFTLYVRSPLNGVNSYQSTAVIHSTYETAVASSSPVSFNSLSTSWQKLTLSFTVTSAMLERGCQVFIENGSSDLNVTNTNALYRTAEWQLELGSVATDFEHRSYGEELALCQRYYQLNASSTGQTYSSTVGTFAINLFTPMRDIPTAVVVATSNKIMHIGTAYRNAVNVQAMELNTLYGGTINITMSSTASDARHILTGGTVGFDAEL